MTARFGLWGGLAVFILMLLLPAPEAMPPAAWRTTAIIVLMATWWMTEALPLTATALVPFLAFPLFGIMSATASAAVLLFADPVPGARRRDHRAGDRAHRAPPAPRSRHRHPRQRQPGPAAVRLHGRDRDPQHDRLQHRDDADHDADRRSPCSAARIKEGQTDGFAGALAMGIAFAATIGGFGTLVGSPTNAIAAGIIEKAIGFRIDFLTWALYGMPLVLVSIPLCWLILMKVQRVQPTDFDPAAARAGIGEVGRLVARREAAGAAGRVGGRRLGRAAVRASLFPEGFGHRRHHRSRRRASAVRHPRRHRPGDPQLGRSQPRALGRDHDVRRRPRAGRGDWRIGPGRLARSRACGRSARCRRS